jgi:plastocyanin
MPDVPMDPDARTRHRTTRARRRARSVAGALIVAAALAACGSDSTSPYGGGGTNPSGGGHAQTIQATPNLAFSPTPDTVAVGSTVTFQFGSVAHNVFFAAAPGAPADITGANANVSITRTVNSAGRYTFECHLHPGMSGTLVAR